MRFLNALVKICQIHVIFQITSQFFFKFYDSSVSRKVTPLYFFGSKVIYFARKGPMKVQILETFKCSDQNSPNSCHFWNNKFVFLQILHQSSVSWDIIPLYIFSFNFIYFQKKEPIKIQIWWNFTRAVKTFLKFCTFMSAFCKNHIKFQLKNTEESSLVPLKSDAKFKEKLTCRFKYDMNDLVNFHQTTQKSESIWGLS